MAFDEVEQRVEVAESRATTAEQRSAELADAVAAVMAAVVRTGAARRDSEAGSSLRAALDALRRRLAAG